MDLYKKIIMSELKLLKATILKTFFFSARDRGVDFKES